LLQFKGNRSSAEPKGRGWFVTISGTQHNLGRDKKAAYHEYHPLMRQPENQRKISGQSLVAIFDDFLDWVQKNKAPDTYRWYRDLLQKFIETRPMRRRNLAHLHRD